MTGLFLLAPSRFGYGHRLGGAVHALVTFVVRAALWSEVYRMVWHVPGGMLLPVVGVTALAFLLSRRRRG